MYYGKCDSYPIAIWLLRYTRHSATVYVTVIHLVGLISRIAGSCRKVLFSGMVDLYHFAGLIFADVRFHARYVLYNWAYFVGLIIRKNCEIWTPQKFPAIWYVYYYGVLKNLILNHRFDYPQNLQNLDPSKIFSYMVCLLFWSPEEFKDCKF